MLLKLSLNLTLRSPQLTYGAGRELNFGRRPRRRRGGLGCVIDGVVTAAGPGGQPGVLAAVCLLLLLAQGFKAVGWGRLFAAV